MKNRTETIKENKFSKQSLHQKVISNLSSELGIPDVRAGNVTIRDERGWRVNEKEIAYCWMINIAKSFGCWCWIFSIKFNASNFRGIENPEQLIQGIFTIGKEGQIEIFHSDNKVSNFEDGIRSIPSYDMFDANMDVSLDGVGYEYLVFAPNTEMRISLNNPNSENWRTWENEVSRIGRDLAEKSGVTELKEIFK